MEALPVVLLAFANATEPHLSLLKAESAALWNALAPLKHTGRLEVAREESTELAELHEALLAHGDRLVVFHYAGHASGTTLELEGGAAHADGVARLLGRQRGLKLVVLNGCATRDQAALLLEAGVAAVIATAVPIGDEKAARFSAALYEALAAGRSIPEAFETARGVVESAFGGAAGTGITFTRGVGGARAGDAVARAGVEWGLHVHPGAADDVAQWRLPEARAAWRVALSDTRGPLRDVDGAPVEVERLEPQRTVAALACATCGCTTQGVADGAPCPVCGAATGARAPVTTTLAEARVPMQVDEAAARRAVLAWATPTGPAPRVTLTPVEVPYWVLDLDTRTTVTGDRGLPQALATAVPTLDWEPVTAVVDLQLARYLIAAGPMPAAGPADARWYWELNAAAPARDAGGGAALPAGTARVVLDRPLQSAFEVASAHLADALEAEVAERLGGVARRNVETDTRYRRVAARTVLLPHWCAVVADGGATRHCMVNGQTGAVRAMALGAALPALAARDQGGSRDMAERTYEPGTSPARPDLRIAAFSGIGIGLMVGVLLGLSISPVVGYFIGAVGTGLAALLGLNDRHFSAAKGVRIGAFGFATVAGAAIGIYARTHDVFARSLQEQKAEIERVGYRPEEALAIMSARLGLRGVEEASSATPAPRRPFGFDNPGVMLPRPDIAPPKAAGGAARSADPSAFARTNLFGSEISLGTCSELRLPNEDTITDSELVAAMEQVKEWKSVVASVTVQFVPGERKPVLLAARDVACDAANRPRPRPSAAQCRTLRSASAPVATVEAAFRAVPGLAAAETALQSLPEGSQPAVRRLLIDVACQL